MRSRLKDLCSSIAELDVVPGSLTTAEAAELVGDLSRACKQLSAVLSVVALRAAEGNEWRRDADGSPADWVSRKTGRPVGQCKEELSAAEAVDAFPELRDAFLGGALSGAQAAAAVEVAKVDPGSAAELVERAGTATVKQFREECTAKRDAAMDDRQRRARARRKRCFRTGVDGDGMHFVHARGPAEEIALVQAQVAARATNDLYGTPTDPAAPRDTYDNRAYDAFMGLINDAIDTAHASASAVPVGALSAPVAAPAAAAATAGRAGSGSPVEASAPTAGVVVSEPGLFDDPGDGPAVEPPDPPPGASGSPPAAVDPDPPPKAGTGKGKGSGKVRRGRRRRNVDAKVIVVIDQSALVRGHTVAGERCEILGIGQVPVASVDEVFATMDPFVAAVISNGVDVFNVAHLGRKPTAYQRTAIEVLRGQQCTNSLCNRTIALEIDHRDDWAKVLETLLRNLEPLCPRCHDHKTHHGWKLEAGTGRRRLLPPDHPHHPDNTASPDGDPGTAAPKQPGLLDPRPTTTNDDAEDRSPPGEAA